MIGFDDRGAFDDDNLRPARGIIAGLCIMLLVYFLVAAAVLWLSYGNAHAQNQPSNCSGTAEVTAAAITFGHPPTQYVFIINPSASQSLWLSTSGTAAANASGSFPLLASGNSVTLPGMPTVSIIASAGSTPYTCVYR